MNETGIIWTEKTWNPMSGCQKISQGCKYCYAEALAELRRGTPAFPQGFELTLRPHKLKEPFKLKEPTLIFANSMSDLFWDQVPDDYRHKILDVIEQTPQHEYQVLTKRPDIMLDFSQRRPFPPNFWAGVSIEAPESLPRLSILKEVKADIRFLSLEPLLKPILFQPDDLTGIHWVITGGESGAHLLDPAVCEKRGLARHNTTSKRWEPREDRIAWVRAIKDYCISHGVHFFHKQWGGFKPESAGRLLDGQVWTDFPRLPAQRTVINNEYLHLIESQVSKDGGVNGQKSKEP